MRERIILLKTQLWQMGLQVIQKSKLKFALILPRVHIVITIISVQILQIWSKMVNGHFKTSSKQTHTWLSLFWPFDHPKERLLSLQLRFYLHVVVVQSLSLADRLCTPGYSILYKLPNILIYILKLY